MVNMKVLKRGDTGGDLFIERGTQMSRKHNWFWTFRSICICEGEDSGSSVDIIRLKRLLFERPFLNVRWKQEFFLHSRLTHLCFQLHTYVGSAIGSLFLNLDHFDKSHIC